MENEMDTGECGFKELTLSYHKVGIWSTIGFPYSNNLTQVPNMSI